MHRIGSLDNPDWYDRRSVAVYESSTGLYIKIDGVQQKLRRNQRWTSLENVKMIGEEPVNSPSPPPHQAFADDEDAQLAQAIEASLREGASVGGEVMDHRETSTSDDSSSSLCAICLTEPRSTLNRPCMHIAMCSGCARRMIRQPCVMCRRNVTKIEQVFL